MPGLSINQSILDDSRYLNFVRLMKKKSEESLLIFINAARYYLGGETKNGIYKKPSKIHLNRMIRSKLVFMDEDGVISFCEDLIYYYYDRRPLFTED